jgi:hypothetical protein
VNHWSRGAAVLVAMAALGAVALAGWLAASEPTTKPAPTASARPSATVPFPSAEPSFDLQFPLTTTEVRAGNKVTITGNGPRQVAFRVADESRVTARLDCSLCTGLLTYVAGDRPEPLFRGMAPYTGEHEVAEGSRQGLLRVDAVGRWTLTLTPRP